MARVTPLLPHLPHCRLRGAGGTGVSHSQEPEASSPGQAASPAHGQLPRGQHGSDQATSRSCTHLGRLLQARVMALSRLPCLHSSVPWRAWHNLLGAACSSSQLV